MDLNSAVGNPLVSSLSRIDLGARSSLPFSPEELLKLTLISLAAWEQKAAISTPKKNGRVRKYASLHGHKKLDLNSNTFPDHKAAIRQFKLAKKQRGKDFKVTSVKTINGIHYRDIKVPLATLKPDSVYNGQRILYLSDIHFGEDQWMVGRLAQINNQLPELNIDIVMLGGDYVNDHAGEFTDQAVDILSSINKRVKYSYAVLGNHDYYGSSKTIIEKLQHANCQVLRDQIVKLGTEEDLLQIVGLDDPYTSGKPLDDPRIDYSQLNTLFPTIMLGHSVDLLSEFTPDVFDLALSGHLHGMVATGLPLSAKFLGDWAHEVRDGSLPSLFYNHNKQLRNMKGLSPRCLSFISNGLVDRERHVFGHDDGTPFQAAEATIIELCDYSTFSDLKAA